MVASMGINSNQNPFLKSFFSVKTKMGRMKKEARNQHLAMRNLTEINFSSEYSTGMMSHNNCKMITNTIGFRHQYPGSIFGLPANIIRNISKNIPIMGSSGSDVESEGPRNKCTDAGILSSNSQYENFQLRMVMPANNTANGIKRIATLPVREYTITLPKSISNAPI
jgi:hypothetical protein